MKKLCRMVICLTTMVVVLSGCQANEQNVETTENIKEESSSMEGNTPILVPTELPTNTPSPTVTTTQVPEIEEEDVVVQEMPEEQEESDSVELESLSISERLQNGDFSCLVESDVVENDEIERVYHIHEELGDAKWTLYDMNGDGIEDLIFQEVSNYGNMNPIGGIFACYEDYARCIYWDEADYTYYMFFSSTEKLMLYSWNGGIYSCVYYGCYEYDENWNRELVYGLVGYRIYDFIDLDREEWIQEHPEMGEVGSYFFRVTEVGGVEQDELLEQDEFLRLYEELTGFPFNDWKLE